MTTPPTPTDITSQLDAALGALERTARRPLEQELAALRERFTEDLARGEDALRAYVAVDQEIRGDLDRWRQLLARDVLGRHPHIARALEAGRVAVAEALGFLDNPDALRALVRDLTALTPETFAAGPARYVGWERDQHQRFALLFAGAAAARERHAVAGRHVHTIMEAVKQDVELLPAPDAASGPVPPPPRATHARTTSAPDGR